MTDRWYKLLAYWMDFEFRHSLTFPFMVGALRTPVGSVAKDEHSAIAELAILVIQVSDFVSEDYFLHIYLCPDLNKFVLTRIKGQTPPSTAIAVSSSHGGRSNVYASDTGITESIISQDALVEILLAEGGKAIVNGQFSCRGKLFQPFDADDLQFIARAFA